MELAPSHRKAAVMVILCVALGMVGSAAAKPQSNLSGSQAGSACARPHTRTLLETTKVRVYALAAGSSSRTGHRETAISGPPVFGCLKVTGTSRLLDFPEADTKQIPYWVGVDRKAFAVSAPLLAYAYSQYGTDAHETWVRVRNLRTGEVVRTCAAGGDLAPGTLPRFGRIVLDSRAAVAWSAQTQEGNVVYDCDASGSTRLDRGDGVELESLSLERSVIHWTDAGEERQAALG